MRRCTFDALQYWKRKESYPEKERHSHARLSNCKKRQFALIFDNQTSSLITTLQYNNAGVNLAATPT
jgi:hypothetical protein